jgi:hypothetical protein
VTDRSIPTHEKRALVRLLRFLARGEAAVTPRDDGLNAEIETADGAVQLHRLDAVGQATSLGLALRNGDRLALTSAARSFLRRAAAESEEAFLAQHADLATAAVEIDGTRQPVRLNRAESPMGPLSRLKDRDGGPFLPPEAVAAGERIAADFMRAQLQPRVTASWEPRLSSRSNGGRGGMADLADGVVAARLAVNRAVEAMGPELAGVALDVCCFMKGLETVERERQWPVRSAKLMLRTALMALSRHYSPPRRSAPASMRHWGAEDYRPEFS